MKLKPVPRVLSLCLCILLLCLLQTLPVLSKEQQKKPAEEGIIKSAGHSIAITMYSQKDPAWANYLYGGQDPMAVYGCGPTALAIVVSSLTDTALTPPGAADWSFDNGCFSHGNGSVHRLIPDGAAAYGLHTEKLSFLTPESFRLALSFDKLLVLLMGPGDFTDSGHFIVAYGYDADGNIRVADPASNERSAHAWPPETLISQLSKHAFNGGPAWAVSKP